MHQASRPRVHYGAEQLWRRGRGLLYTPATLTGPVYLRGCEGEGDRARCDWVGDRGRCDWECDRGRCDWECDRGRCDWECDRGRCDWEGDRARCDWVGACTARSVVMMAKMPSASHTGTELEGTSSTAALNDACGGSPGAVGEWEPPDYSKTNTTYERPGPFCVRAALLKTTNFTRGFRGWFRAGAQRAARQAVGPALFPAPAFHGRSPHCPMWPNRRPAGRPPMPDQRRCL